MNMLIAIPSRGRHSKQVTLRNFKTLKMPNQPVLCVPEQEVERYRAYYPSSEIVAVPKSHEGIARTREWIMMELTRRRGERHVLMLDDDMDFCYRPVVTEAKLETIATADRLQAMIDRLQKWLTDGFVHVGLSARQGNNNPFYDDNKNYGLHEYRDATRMMNAYAYDVEELAKLDVKLGRMQVMEDFDLTLQLLRLGFPNRVLFEYCWNQRGSGAQGGCSSYRTAEMQAASAHRLKEFHPDFVRITAKKNKEGSGAWEGMKERVDVTVDWRKAFASAFDYERAGA